MSRLTVAIALALALPACDPGAEPDHVEAHCAPEVAGDTCPYTVGDAAEAAALLDELVACREGEAVVGSEPGDGIVERGCFGPGYRYPAGGFVPGWGFTYPTPGGALVRCDPEGRIAEVWPLAECDDGRRGLVLDEAWVTAVEAGRCWEVSDLCESP